MLLNKETKPNQTIILYFRYCNSEKQKLSVVKNYNKYRPSKTITSLILFD